MVHLSPVMYVPLYHNFCLYVCPLTVTGTSFCPSTPFVALKLNKCLREGRERTRVVEEERERIFSPSTMPSTWKCHIRDGWIRKKGHLCEWQEATSLVWAIHGRSSPMQWSETVEVWERGTGAEGLSWCPRFILSSYVTLDGSPWLTSFPYKTMVVFIPDFHREVLLRFLLLLLQTL